MKMNKIHSIAPFVCLITMVTMSIRTVSAQDILSKKDSLLIETVKLDTTKLRELSERHKGKKVGARVLREIGINALKAKKYDEADKEFKTLRNSYLGFEESKDVVFLSGRVAFLKGREATTRNSDAEAKQHFEQYIGFGGEREFTEAAEYYLNRVLSRMKTERPDANIKRWRKFITKRPNAFYTPHAKFSLIQEYKKRKDYASAIGEAKSLIEKYPESNYAKDLRYQLGDFYCQLGTCEEAKNHFRKLVQANPANTEPAAIGQYLLAELYEKDGDLDGARGEYAKVKKHNPAVSNWSILSDFAIALTYHREGNEHGDTIKLGEAQKRLEQFCKDYPTDKRTPRAMMTLASMAQHAQRFEDALQWFDSVIGFDTTSISNVAPGHRVITVQEHIKLVMQAHLSRGNIFRTSMSKPEIAVIEYETVLKSDLTNGEALIGKALCLLDTGREEEAKAILRQVASGTSEVRATAEQILTGLQ